MTTIRTLAAEYGAQPYEIAATLDLGRNYDETAEIAPTDEVWMREALGAATTAREDTLGACGCIDYHMADCPIMTGGRDYYDEPDYDDGYGFFDY